MPTGVVDRRPDLEVALPLRVDFREGREIVRDAEGQAAGVVDATYADVGWDYPELEMVP